MRSIRKNASKHCALPEPMVIKTFRYNKISDAALRSLNDLFIDVWSVEAKEIHPAEMDAMSFCAMIDGKCTGYVGVIAWDIIVRDRNYSMCGLSCLCTHPLYRNRGIATGLVKEATEWIVRSKSFDIGLFTCSPQNTAFYESIGLWEKSPDLILKESDREGAYKSDTMKLDVFKLLISEKTKLYAGDFKDMTLILRFPEGKFI